MLNMKRYICFLMILSLFLVSGCNGEDNHSLESNGTGGTSYYTFEDFFGNEVVLNEKPKDVVSLLGSYAETWVLAGGELAGVTDDVISEGRIDVTDNMKIVGTIKDPNVEEILSLSPDFILLSSDIDSHVKISKTFQEAGIPCAFFKVECFEDYLNMLDVCTDITGRKDLYEKNGILVQEEIQDVLSKIADAKTRNYSVLFIRAFSSGAKAKNGDNMTCKMLEDLGTVNIAEKHESLLEELSIEEIIEEDPEYIFVTTMGDTDKAIDSLKNGIEKNPAWGNLTAVKNGRYIILPKELFHYKPNAKWGESYRYLAEIIYPEIFE